MLYAVYGTLKSGFHNHNRLLKNDHVSFIGEFITSPNYTMYSLGGFPAVVNGGNTSIKMEVFEVKHDIVEHKLDQLEGFYGENDPHNFYDKDKIETPFGEAYVYLMHKDTLDLKGAPIVDSGVWE